jgi:uncharacterized protein YgiM (DUF1202 family)
METLIKGGIQMSHTNYNAVSTNKPNSKDAEVAPTVNSTPEIDTTNTPAELEQLAWPVGVVADCVKLNVRKEPDLNAAILFTIDKDVEVEIDLESSTAEWYKVIVNNQEGFCMKKYISLPQ